VRPGPGLAPANLTADGQLLFASRFVRLFAYGALSVVLVLYLTSIGLNETQAGVVLSLTLAGDTAISLLLTTRADAFGRRRTLIIGALLMAGAGFAFAFTRNFWLLVAAGIIGVISPSGNEAGPFLSIEQAALSHVVPARGRTWVFGWHALTASLGGAAGALAGGVLVHSLESGSTPAFESYRAVVLAYGVLGLVLILFFARLSSAVEVRSDGAARPVWSWGITHSRKAVLKLSALFALDSFAGGYVTQSLAAYWFSLRFGVNPQTLGMIFFSANILAGVSALLASRLAERFGLVNTMVFTHLPSNVLLLLVPLMPNLGLATLMLLLRFSISQMDVPTRQAYLMAVVRPEERSATAGITGVARTAGAAVAPALAGLLLAHRELMNVPFFIAGGLKIVYDLLLYREFVGVAIDPAAEQASQ
jgi:MFS family permease